VRRAVDRTPERDHTEQRKMLAALQQQPASLAILIERKMK